MTVVLEQRFLLGMFHATRWNESPFEDPFGEWPPSPWRLLRTLAARWFQYVREIGGDDVDKRDALLRALASSPPAFYLPPNTWKGPEVRQYQPTEVAWTNPGRKAAAVKRPKRSLVADCSQVLAPDAPIFWYWSDLDLPAEQARLLDRLLERTLYFGRAESFCLFRRLDALPNGIRPNCFLVEKDTGDMRPVLVPLPGASLDLDIVLAATDDARLKGRRIPPGTKWFYARLPMRPVLSTHSRKAPIEEARLNCLQFAVGGTVLPRVGDWVKVTERFRGRTLRFLSQALTNNPKSHYGVLNPEQRSKLALVAGKDGAGKPLHGHRHAFFLLWPDEDNRPARLIVWRSKPFESQEIRAMLAASEEPIPWDQAASKWSVRLVPLPFETPPPKGLLNKARIWHSATPFVPPASRHRFRKGGRPRIGESLGRIVGHLLEAEGRSKPSRVTLLGGDGRPLWMNLHATREIRLHRRESREPWIRPGYHIGLEFEESVAGPLVLGDSCHFGLGLFMPMEEAKTL